MCVCVCVCVCVCDYKSLVCVQCLSLALQFTLYPVCISFVIAIASQVNLERL